MKKLLLALIVLCALAYLCIYVFIPSKIEFSKVMVAKAKMSVASRSLVNESNWYQWFPGNSIKSVEPTSEKQFFFRGSYYTLEKKAFNAAEILISSDEMTLTSIVHMISINDDSIGIEWKSEMPPTSNPFNRIKNYFKARKLQKNFGDILSSFKTFLGDKEKVYGVYFHEIISNDSTLVAMQCVTRDYPSVQKIYTLVHGLKKYIANQNAKENNFPMLNVKQRSDSIYETTVAIPVNRSLTGNDSILNKRFVPWKVLTAEVKGGIYTVNKAMHQMEVYISDYHKEAMAIPFQSLVTDRSKEPDTLKWITHIYTPIR